MLWPMTDGRSTSADAPPVLVDALRDLASMMAEPTTIEGILQRVGNWCAEILPADGVGVLVRDDDGRLLVATASSPLGQVVEQLESDLGDGPCAVALVSGLVVEVPDLEDALDEHPHFAPAALAAGVRGVYGIPMTIRSRSVGALNIISRDRLVLTASELATAQLLADVTMSYTANSRMLEESTELAGHLQRALDSRVVIEQAKGVLSERHGVGIEPAFERMRRHARSNRMPIHQVAEAVTDRSLSL
jgi:GAF domain-containing protein